MAYDIGGLATNSIQSIEAYSFTYGADSLISPIDSTYYGGAALLATVVTTATSETERLTYGSHSGELGR